MVCVNRESELRSKLQFAKAESIAATAGLASFKLAVEQLQLMMEVASEVQKIKWEAFQNAQREYDEWMNNDG